MAYGIPSGGTGGFRGWNAGGGNRQIPQGRPPIKGPPGSGGGGGKPGQGPTPLDAQYFLNVAANQFKVNGELNALNQQSGYARTDLQNALSNLSRQQPLDNLHAEQGANARGSLFSTALGQQLGQLNQNYLDRQSAANQNFERGEAGRQASEQSILGGVPIYDAGQYLAAVQRASLLAQKDPATGQKTGPLVKGGHGHGNTSNPRGGGRGPLGFTRGQWGQSWGGRVGQAMRATGQLGKRG